MANRDLLEQYANLWDLRRAKKADLKEIETTMAKLAEELLEEFEQEGVSQIRIDGRLFYTRRDVYFSLTEQSPAAFETLEECGLGHLIKTAVPSQALRSALLELERKAEPLTPELTALVKRSEVFRLQVK